MNILEILLVLWFTVGVSVVYVYASHPRYPSRRNFKFYREALVTGVMWPLRLLVFSGYLLVCAGLNTCKDEILESLIKRNREKPVKWLQQVREWSFSRYYQLWLRLREVEDNVEAAQRREMFDRIIECRDVELIYNSYRNLNTLDRRELKHHIAMFHEALYVDFKEYKDKQEAEARSIAAAKEAKFRAREEMIERVMKEDSDEHE